MGLKSSNDYRMRSRFVEDSSNKSNLGNVSDMFDSYSCNAPTFSSETLIQYAPPFFPIPTDSYGGVERIVQGLSENLCLEESLATELWCAGDAYKQHVKPPDLRLKVTASHSYGLNKPFKAFTQIMTDLHAIAERLKSDPSCVAHIHSSDLHLPVFGQDVDLATRTLTTLHNPPQLWYEQYPAMPLVAISQAQANLLNTQRHNFVRIVHNGIDGNLFKPREELEPDAPLTFLGRFSPEKNPIAAIEIALAANLPIKLAGTQDKQHPNCLEDIKAFEARYGYQKVQYVGPVSDQVDPPSEMSSKNLFLRSSRAMLFPIRWKEPFGLVVIEANACGTPVIAFDHPGSAASELIKDGVNGYLVKTVEQAVEAVKAIQRIDRSRVRAYFDEHFRLEVMVQRYLEILYEDLPTYRRQMLADRSRNSVWMRTQ